MDIEKNFRTNDKLTNQDIKNLEKAYSKNPEEVVDLIYQKIEMSKSESYAGPIPHHDVIKGYGEIDESFPDRIIKMSEKELDHRIELEDFYIKESIKLNKIGMFFAFCITLTALIAGFVLIYNDKDGIGIASIIGALAGVIGFFFINNQKESNDNNIG